MPTATLEEYLEAIYKLSVRGLVRPSDIAEAMGVSAPTITATLRRLEHEDLITRPERAVALTIDGEREALSILRRHRLAERFLVDVLGLPWDDVHEDACLLEHALSSRVQDALERYMGNPTVCPHGHPIPTRDLLIPEGIGIHLTEAAAGTRVRVVSVDERDEGILSLVGSLGLYPGTVLRIAQADTEDGAILVDIASSRSTLTREVAGCVVVVPERGDEHA